MRILLLIAGFILLAACQHSAVAPRTPSSEDVAGKVLKLLPAGQYKGLTNKNVKCDINVTGTGDSVTVSITPANFKFDKEKGSSECMYSKTCFSYDKSMKITDLEETISSVDVSVKRPGGGPDMASSKKMSLQVVRDFNNSGKLIVVATEHVGVFNIGKVEETCLIAQ